MTSMTSRVTIGVREEHAMGLFDKRDKGKRRDDFDSPVERVDLDGALDEPGGGEPSSPMAQSGYGSAPAAPAAPARAASAEPEEPEVGGFGIDKAIQLMRT